MRQRSLSAALSAVCLGLVAGSLSGSAAASGFAPPPGTLWVKLSYARWTADERFAGPFNAEDLNVGGGREPGDLVPLKPDVPGSTFTNETVAIDLQVTPVDRFTLGVYLPVYQRSEFDQRTVAVVTQGTGDVFAFAGYQLTPPGIPVGSTFNVHLKIPTTEAQFEDLSVPLTEGQVDLGFEQVTTWAVLPRMHLTARLLYRIRFQVEQDVGDATARFKPGNETELGLELGGGPFAWLWLRASWSGLFAAAREDRSVPSAILADEQRTVHHLEVGAYLSFGQWIHDSVASLALDAWFRHPVAGTDYLFGPSFSVGLAWDINWHR